MNIANYQAVDRRCEPHFLFIAPSYSIRHARAASAFYQNFRLLSELPGGTRV